MSFKIEQMKTGSSEIFSNDFLLKVWNAARTVRKALVVSTYEEFHRKGREKLGLGKVEPIRVVLESDGTQVNSVNSDSNYCTLN